MIEQIGDRLNPIIGWRGWYSRRQPLTVGLSSEHYLDAAARHVLQQTGSPYALVSGNSCPWVPREELTAVCANLWSYSAGGAWANHEKDIPVEECSCGIYALDSLDRLKQSAYRFTIFGEVKLWGKIVVGEHGYRAQYAYPASLYVPADLCTAELNLLELFGVPIRDRAELGDMSGEHFPKWITPPAIPWTVSPSYQTVITSGTAVTVTPIDYTTADTTNQITWKWQWVNNLFNKQDDQKK